VACTGGSEKALWQTRAPLCFPQIIVCSYSYFSYTLCFTHSSCSHSSFLLFFRYAVLHRECGCSRLQETMLSPTKLHCITYHKIIIFMCTAVGTSRVIQTTNISIKSTLGTRNFFLEGGGPQWCQRGCKSEIKIGESVFIIGVKWTGQLRRGSRNHKDL